MLSYNTKQATGTFPDRSAERLFQQRQKQMLWNMLHMTSVISPQLSEGFNRGQHASRMLRSTHEAGWFSSQGLVPRLALRQT